MIAPIEQIKELLRGETEELLIDQEPPETGKVVAVQPKVGKRAKCRVLVVDSWEHKDGGHVVLVKVVPVPHTPRLLPRAGGDYVSAAAFALMGLDGAGPEPEAVPKEAQERITADAHMLGHQENVRRRLDFEKRTLLERLEDAIIEQERLGVDSTRDMARLEAGIAKIERRNVLARQQRSAA